MGSIPFSELLHSSLYLLVHSHTCFFLLLSLFSLSEFGVLCRWWIFCSSHAATLHESPCLWGYGFKISLIYDINGLMIHDLMIMLEFAIYVASFCYFSFLTRSFEWWHNDLRISWYFNVHHGLRIPWCGISMLRTDDFTSRLFMSQIHLRARFLLRRGLDALMNWWYDLMTSRNDCGYFSSCISICSFVCVLCFCYDTRSQDLMPRWIYASRLDNST